MQSRASASLTVMTIAILLTHCVLTTLMKRTHIRRFGWQSSGCGKNIANTKNVYCMLSIMPAIRFHDRGEVFTGEVKDNTNLVVRAGIKQFPYPHLRYGCGMGKCAKCACRVLAGGEHLPAANWKEKKQLGELLDEGYRLMCQLWIQHDIELVQDDRALERNAAP